MAAKPKKNGKDDSSDGGSSRQAGGLKEATKNMKCQKSANLKLLQLPPWIKADANFREKKKEANSD